MQLLRRLAVSAMPLAIFAACGDIDKPDAAPAPTGIPGAAARTESGAQALTTFHTRRFTRGTGAPETVSASISTAGYRAPFTITVTNGAPDGSARVSSARIVVDGEQLLGTSDFSQRAEGWSFDRALGATVALEVTLASAPGSFIEVAIAGTPAGVRFCPGTTDGFATLREALDAAAAAAGGNGTVLVCDGAHVVTAVDVTRGVTIRSENPGGATLVAGDLTETLQAALEILEVPAGETVRIVDLGFSAGTETATGYAVWASDFEGRVEIDSSRFTGGVLARHAFIHTTVPRAAAVATVSRSEFRGGLAGIWQQGPIAVHAYGNTFDGVNSPIQFQGVMGAVPSVPSEIIGNTMTNCGSTCLRAAYVGNVRIEDNTMSNVVGRPVQWGIFVRRTADAIAPGPIVVRNNRILGSGLGSDREANASYAFRNAGIFFMDSTSAATDRVIDANEVSSAFNGINIQRGAALATNNVVTGTRHGITFGGPTPPAAIARRNDIVDAFMPFAGPQIPAGTLTCNWWGSTYAPGIPEWIDGSAYSPWATAPIAGTDTPCNPAAMPALVKVCSTPDGTTPMTLLVGQAVNVVAAGGTVVLCDGTHVTRDVPLGRRSLTIRAENPLGATVDASGGWHNFGVHDAPGAITFRGLRFVNSRNNNIAVWGTYGSVLVENSEFHPTQSMNYGDPLVGGPESIGYRAGVGAYDAVGGGVTVRNSTFLGGDIGFNSANSANLRVEGNTFRNQNNAAVHIGGGPGEVYAGSATIVNNVVDGCSSHWCIGVFGASDVTITGNTLQTTAARRTRTAVTVRAANAVVTDNTITGTSLGGDRAQPASYDVEFGISFYQTANATADRNRVTRAHRGIWVDQSTATARDNFVTASWTPLGAWGPPTATPAQLTANRNDLVDWGMALEGSYIMPSPNVRCNFWGATPPSAATAPGFAASTYTPYATAPIAGTTTSCTP